MDKLIIEARINEYATRKRNGNVPWLPHEIARDARQCHDAGASIVHFHGRDAEGGPDNRFETCRDTVLAIRAATGHLAQFRLFGTDYPTPDGTCLRDYIHVTDLAAAHLAALRYLDGKEGAHSFNLGTGEGVSVRAVLSAVERVTGKPVPTVEVDRRAGDPPMLFAANAKARRELNWQPACSDIDSIVRSAVAWDAVLQQRRTQSVA